MTGKERNATLKFFEHFTSVMTSSFKETTVRESFAKSGYGKYNRDTILNNAVAYKDLNQQQKTLINE